MAQVTPLFSEQALLLGPHKSIVGVLAQAPVAARLLGAPFIVILNAGIIHRVGPNRVYVALARNLAASGFRVLRVDLSGLGDSEVRGDHLDPLSATMADIREVLDTLQATYQVERVVLAGLCSGADHSVVYAASDRRVVGVALIDPSVPHTARYYLHHYAGRVLRLRSWINVVLGRNNYWTSILRGLAPASRSELRGDMAPKVDDPEVRAFLQGIYRQAVANGVQFLAVLTGGVEARHNHRRQLLDAFPQVRFGSSMRLDYHDDLDHTFTSEASRMRIVELIDQWMRDTHFRAALTGTISDRSA